jgi:magnesium-transporting ATPase (P-type)
VTDDNFASIAAGVEEGRFTYENLRKIIYFLISTAAGLVITVALSIIFMNTNQLPFIPVQLLWLNLVTNGIQDVAMAFEKGDISVMKKAPRKPGESIFDKLMNLQILWSGAWIALLSFGLWYMLVNVQGYETEEEMVHARTLVVMLVVLLQNFQAINARSETKSFWKVPVKNNYLLIGGIVVAQLLHISASYIPGLNNVLQLDPIRLDEWLKLLPTAMSLIVVMEIFKWWWRRKTGADNEVVRSEYTEVEKAKEKDGNLSRPSVA